MSTIVISTAVRCDAIDRCDRRMLAPSDRMFQYMPCAIKEMLWVVFVRLVSNCRVLGLACATTELDRMESTVKRVYLKERREYSVLALYSDSDGIDLSKTRIDFANEVWGARERMLEGRIEEGWGEGRGREGRGEVGVQASELLGGPEDRRDGVGRQRLFRGGLGTGTRTHTRTAATCKKEDWTGWP
jgi:hypothetical protein